MVNLDIVWAEFDVLDNAKAKKTKRMAFLLRISKALPRVSILLITHPDTKYGELNQAVMASTNATFDTVISCHGIRNKSKRHQSGNSN